MSIDSRITGYSIEGSGQVRLFFGDWWKMWLSGREWDTDRHYVILAIYRVDRRNEVIFNERLKWWKYRFYPFATLRRGRASAVREVGETGVVRVGGKSR